MKYPLRLFSFHDIHLGHHRTLASHIIQKLTRVMTTKQLAGVDVLFIAGDLFDRVLLYSDETIYEIQLFFIHFLEVVNQTNTIVRIVEGTPSHDGKQAIHLEQLAKRLYPHLDLKYYQDMEIEYIEKIDAHILYVPDEWAARDVMYATAIRLLDEHQLDKVDFIVGHNQFSYQFPEHLRGRVTTLNEEDWNNIVSHNAFFGHIHRRSSYKNIEIAGSFDRLAHGEEDPKGYLECLYLSPTEKKITFHHNEEAEIYKTIELEEDFSMGNEEYLKRLFDILDQLKRDRFNLRFMYNFEEQHQDVEKLCKFMQPKYPFAQFTMKFKATHTSDDKKEEVLPDDETYECIDINKTNIVRLVSDILPHTEDKEKILALLETYVDKAG